MEVSVTAVKRGLQILGAIGALNWLGIALSWETNILESIFTTVSLGFLLPIVYLLAAVGGGWLLWDVIKKIL